MKKKIPSFKINIDINKNSKRLVKKVLGDEKYCKLRDKKNEMSKKAKDNKKKRQFEANKNRILHDFLESWRKIMFEKNICDQFDKTVTPYDMNLISNYGSECINCKLDFPFGKSIDDVKYALPALAQNVFGVNSGCMAYLEEVDSKNGKIVTFSVVRKWHNKPYALPKKKLTASQLYLGDDINLNPIILDMAKAPHALITGASGSGKSKVVEVIITTLALSNTPEELELYFLQASKDDQFKYELLKHTKGCVVASSCKSEEEKFDRILMMLEYLVEQIDYRGDLVKNKLGRRSEDINIHVYNKSLSKSDKNAKKLPVLQLWVDEAATMYKETSDKTLNAKVKRIRELTERISATGRFVGVYIINTLQRASKDELSREVKINTSNWISFKQMDAASSHLAIGDEKSALGLPPRVFAVKDGSSNIRYGKTPFSAWDKAVEMLEKQDKIKEENDAQFLLDYSHWLNLNDEEDNSVIPIQNNTSKMVSSELTKMEAKLIEANEKIDSLLIEIKNKDFILKEAQKEIKRLILDDNTVEKNKEDAEKKLDDFSKTGYISAKDQKEKAKELTNSEYVKAPVVNFSKKSKFVVKE